MQFAEATFGGAGVPEGRLLGYEFFLRERKSADLNKWNDSYYRPSQVGVLGIFMGSGLAAWSLALYLTVVLQTTSLLGASSLVGAFVLLVELIAMVYIGYRVSSVVEAARTFISYPGR